LFLKASDDDAEENVTTDAQLSSWSHKKEFIYLLSDLMYYIADLDGMCLVSPF